MYDIILTIFQGLCSLQYLSLYVLPFFVFSHFLIYLKHLVWFTLLINLIMNHYSYFSILVDYSAFLYFIIKCFTWIFDSIHQVKLKVIFTILFLLSFHYYFSFRILNLILFLWIFHWKSCAYHFFWTCFDQPQSFLKILLFLLAC
jgi:hypothetical protein